MIWESRLYNKGQPISEGWPEVIVFNHAGPMAVAVADMKNAYPYLVGKGYTIKALGANNDTSFRVVCIQHRNVVSHQGVQAGQSSPRPTQAEPNPNDMPPGFNPLPNEAIGRDVDPWSEGDMDIPDDFYVNGGGR